MSLDFYAQNARNIIDDVARGLDTCDFSVLTVQNSLDKLRNARSSVDDMERELILLPTNEKSKATNHIRSLRNEISSLEEKLQNGKQRKMLLGDASHLPDASRESYADATNAMSETVKIGNGILSSLSDQKNKLLHSIDGVDSVRNVTNATGMITSRMKSRQNMNKMITYGVIGLLVFAILLLIYLSF